MLLHVAIRGARLKHLLMLLMVRLNEEALSDAFSVCH